MRLNTFESLLDRHGVRLDAWPSDVAADARRLLTGSDAARLVLANAEATDAALRADLSRPVRAPRRLVDTIMARVAELPDEPPATAA